MQVSQINVFITDVLSASLRAFIVSGLPLFKSATLFSFNYCLRCFLHRQQYISRRALHTQAFQVLP